MKRALVLAGGGSKGAYEVGFVCALKEMGIDYQIVTGTSIGALNGCLLAQEDYEEMVKLWDEMDINTVFAGGFSDDFSFLEIDKMLDQSNLVASFFKKFIKEKGADITPLKTLIRSLLKEDQLLSSPIDFGLCTVQFPSLKPVLICKEEMEKEYIFDYLISSASCFPAFPVHTFNGQSYIDGGYYDNVPIDLAFDMGADEVIVVDMKITPTHEHYYNKPRVLYTHPRVDLGGFLDFSREALDRNRRIGYQTAKKAFHQLEGVVYSFHPYDSDIFELFYKEILYLERKMRLSYRNDGSATLTTKIQEATDIVTLTLKDYLYIVLDWLGEISQRDASYIYHFEVFTNDLLQDYQKYADENFRFVRLGSSEDIFETFKDVNKKGIVGRIYNQILYPENEVFKFDKLMTLFPKEVLMAKLLYFLYHQK